MRQEDATPHRYMWGFLSLGVLERIEYTQEELR